jgi:hypothetical protein
MFRSLTAVAVASLAATAVALPAGASAAPAPPAPQQGPTIIRCGTPQQPSCPTLPPPAGTVVCTPQICVFEDGTTIATPAGVFATQPTKKPKKSDDGPEDRGGDRGGHGGDDGPEDR